MAGGSRESRGYPNSILAPCCVSSADPLDLRHNDIAFWQLIWGPCHRLRPDRRPLQLGDAPYRSANLRRCPAQPRARLCSGHRNGNHHGLLHSYLFTPPESLREEAEVTTSSVYATVTVKSQVT